jgi:hypothetical protein
MKTRIKSIALAVLAISALVAPAVYAASSQSLPFISSPSLQPVGLGIEAPKMALSAVSIEEVVNRLITKSGLKLDVYADATMSMRRHISIVTSESDTVSGVLNDLSKSADLFWQVEGKSLRISANQKFLVGYPSEGPAELISVIRAMGASDVGALPNDGGIQYSATRSVAEKIDSYLSFAKAAQDVASKERAEKEVPAKEAPVKVQALVETKPLAIASVTTPELKEAVVAPPIPSLSKTPAQAEQKQDIVPKVDEAITQKPTVPVVLPAVEVAKAPAAPKRQTVLQPGRSIGEQLALWAEADGWQLSWEATDFTISQAITLNGDFVAQVKTLMESANAEGNGINATFYSGNKVLRVVEF